MKRPLLLIEILVGMALFSLLASLLFSLYIGLQKMGGEQKKSEVKIERLITLRTLLQRSLGKAVLQTNQHYFYEENETLYFTFDNGIDPDPAFSSIIKGALFLNEKNDLILEETPLQGSSKRTYVLASDVPGLLFERIPEESLPFCVRVTMGEESFTIILPQSPPIIGMT